MAKFTSLPEGFIEISKEEATGTLPTGFVEIPEQQVFESLPKGFIEVSKEKALESSGQKTFDEAAKHGLRIAGLGGVKGIAGLTKMGAEVGGPLWKYFTPQGALGKKPPKRLQELGRAMKDWADTMNTGVEAALAKHPEELMQFESETFKGRTWELITKPELLLQGALESSVLMLEAGLGTMVGGPVGGIKMMAAPRAGEIYLNSRKEGNSPKIALARAWATALPEAAIEEWTFGRKLGLVETFATKTPMRKALWEFGKLYWRGAVEEGSQQFNENFWRWVFTDRSQQWFENVGTSAAMGGPIEAAMGGFFAGAGKVGTMVPDATKRQRVETIRKIFNEAQNISQDEKTEINKTLDETTEDINAGKYAQAITANQAIGLQYGLSPQDTDKRITDAELRYRELKRKDVKKRTVKEKEELAFLSRQRTNIEALLERETEPTKPIITKANLQNESNIFYLEFDETGKIPEAEEIQNYLNENNIGANATVQRFQRDIVSATKGSRMYRVDVSDKNARSSNSLARKLYKEKIGLPKNFTGQTKAQREIPLEQRFGAVVKYAKEQLTGKQNVIKPKKKSKRDLQVVAHKIAKESTINRTDYEDYAEVVTGKRTTKEMTRREMEDFVTALEESFGSPSEITAEDYGVPIQVGDKETTMGTVINRAQKSVENLPTKREIPEVVPRNFGRKGRRIFTWLKDLTVGIDNTPIFHLARILDQVGDGVFSEVLDANIERGRKEEAGLNRVVHNYLEEGLKTIGLDASDLARMSKVTNPAITIPFIKETVGAIKQIAGYEGNVDTEILTEKINGRSYEMTWGDLIDFYLISNQKDGLRHLKQGGAVINSVKTEALTDEIIADLRLRVEANPKAKAIADLMLEIGEAVWKPAINKTSQKLDGRDIATISNWWGLRVYMPKKLPGKRIKFATAEQWPGINLIEDKSILRDRSKSGAPLIVEDAFSKFTTFEKAISEYVGMAGPSRIARTLINNSTLAAILDQKGYGKVRTNALKILNRAQTGPREKGIFSAFFKQYMPSIYRAVLYYNPRVIVSQATSAANYGAYASPKYMPSMLTGVFKGIGDKARQEVLDFSNIAWDRFYMGHSSLELGEMAKLDTTLRFWTKTSADANFFGFLLKYADTAALASGLEIAKNEYRDAQAGIIDGLSTQWWDGKDVSAKEGSLEWQQAVTERAEWLWQKTQPSWDKWNRSTITSLTGAAKTLFLFRSFHEKALTTCREALLDYENSAKLPEDKLKTGQRIGSVLAGYTINTFLRALITFAMTKELKEPLKYLEDFTTSWLAMFPIFGRSLDSLYRRFLNAATGTKPEYRGEAIEVLPISVVNNFLKSFDNFSSAVGYELDGENEKAKSSYKRGFWQLADGLGPIWGIPSYEIKRIYGGWLKPEETGKRKSVKRRGTKRQRTER